MHAILAHFGGPHWLLDDKDAKTYAAAVQNVARHYDIRAAQKTVDWLNLLGMIAFVEGTRVVAGRAPKPPPRQPGPMGQVFQFTPSQPTPPPSPQGPTTPAASPQAEQRPPAAPPSGGNGPPMAEGPIDLGQGPFH